MTALYELSQALRQLRGAHGSVSRAIAAPHYDAALRRAQAIQGEIDALAALVAELELEAETRRIEARKQGRAA